MGTRGSQDPQDAFSRAPHEAAFENSVRSGTRWVIAAQVGSQLVSLVVLGVLYHLVAPSSSGCWAWPSRSCCSPKLWPLSGCMWPPCSART